MYSNQNLYPSHASNQLRRSQNNGSPVSSPMKKPQVGACPDYKDPSTLGKASSVGTPVEIIQGKCINFHIWINN